MNGYGTFLLVPLLVGYMSKYDFPEEVTDIDTDRKIYTSDEVELIIEGHFDYDGSASLKMYLTSHSHFSNIVPDDIQQCDHMDSREEVSDVSDLPEDYESLFMGAVEEFRDRGFKVATDRVGVCTGCIDFSNPDGVLVFTSFFE